MELTEVEQECELVNRRRPSYTRTHTHTRATARNTMAMTERQHSIGSLTAKECTREGASPSSCFVSHTMRRVNCGLWATLHWHCKGTQAALPAADCKGNYLNKIPLAMESDPQLPAADCKGHYFNKFLLATQSDPLLVSDTICKFGMNFTVICCIIYERWGNALVLHIYLFLQ